MIKEKDRKLKHHLKWGKRLPKPSYVELSQEDWDNLTARQRYELRYPEKAKEQEDYQHRQAHYRKKFGISEAEYAQMFFDQNGLCAICEKPERAMRNGRIIRLAVDHNHSTGEIRRLLCTRCNSILGYADEDIDVLQNAIEYLRWYL